MPKSPQTATRRSAKKGLGQRTTQDVREISDRDEQFVMERTLTNAIGPQEWEEDMETNGVPDHLNAALEQEDGLEAQLAKIQQARGDSMTQGQHGRKGSTPMTSTLSKHSKTSKSRNSRKSPDSKKTDPSNLSRKQKRVKKETDTFLANAEIEPVVEMPREAEESKLFNKKQKRKSKGPQERMAATHAIEENFEIVSGSGNSIQQDASRTQVYRKTPNVVRSPASAERSNKSFTNQSRRSQTLGQKHIESGNKDISEVVDQRTLNIRKSLSSKKTPTSSQKNLKPTPLSSKRGSNRQMITPKHSRKHRKEDSAINYQDGVEPEERSKMPDKWSFEQTFTSPNETGGFHSTDNDQPVDFEDGAGTPAGMDPPTVYINQNADEKKRLRTKNMQSNAGPNQTESNALRESGMGTDYRRTGSLLGEENKGA